MADYIEALSKEKVQFKADGSAGVGCRRSIFNKARVAGILLLSAFRQYGLHFDLVATSQNRQSNFITSR